MPSRPHAHLVTPPKPDAGPAPLAGPTLADARLVECRRRIDAVDKVVVALLAERTRLALEAGRLKQRLALPLSSPAREDLVLARATSGATAPLPPASAGRIFRQILDETLALERGELEASDVQ